MSFLCFAFSFVFLSSFFCFYVSVSPQINTKSVNVNVNHNKINGDAMCKLMVHSLVALNFFCLEGVSRQNTFIITIGAAKAWSVVVTFTLIKTDTAKVTEH
jgi:hypothetical protein